MKGAVRLVVAFTALLVAQTWAEEDVIVGTSKNFEEIIKKNSFVVAEFYAPWCGHCKQLAPEYEIAAHQLKANDPPIVLLKVDATEEGELAKKYNVEGYPTLFIFRDGNLDEPLPYNGPRDSAGIIEYLRKKLEPPSTILQSDEQLTSFKENDPAIVGYFGSEEDAEYKGVFLTIAKKLSEDHSIGHVLKSSGLLTGKTPSLRLFKSNGEEEFEYTGEWEPTALTKWIEVTGAPLVIELNENPKNRQAMQAAFRSELPKLYSLLSKEEDGYTSFQRDLRKSVETVKGQAYFINVEASSNQRALGFFGLTEENLPAFIIQDGDARFFKENAKASEAASFLQDFKDGKVERRVKSEEPPADNSKPVKVVVGKTFDDIVLSGNNVLIEFYAPWCGHCKKLEPTFDQVGKHFAKRTDVTIAKIDATTNDVIDKRFDVKGFPTLYLVTKDGNVLPYSGDRSEKDLIKFVESSSVGASGDHTEL